MTEITACPECDSSNIHARSEWEPVKHSRKTSGAWYCNDCGAGFDDPVRRERKRNVGACFSGDAAALDQADPDEFP